MGRVFILFCWLVATVTPLPVVAGGHYLGQLTWRDAEAAMARMPVVVLPFAAAAKEHGPHLPMNTDEVIMRYLLDAAVTASPVIVAPPVVHGWFPAFRDYPGTEVADVTVFQRYLLEVARSLVRQGAQRIVFLNMGIRQASGLPIAIVAREIRAEYGVPTLVVSWEDLESEEATALQNQRVGGHADEIETSILLYLQPDRVNMALAETDYREQVVKAGVGYQPGLFSRDPDDPLYSKNGLFGDPTTANAALGEQVLAIMRDNWLRALQEFARVPRPKSLPSAAGDKNGDDEGSD